MCLRSKNAVSCNQKKAENDISDRCRHTGFHSRCRYTNFKIEQNVKLSYNTDKYVAEYSVRKKNRKGELP